MGLDTWVSPCQGSVIILLADSKQSLVSLIFFISYTALQPPATLLTRKIGPRIFLSSITFLWGIVMLGMGFVQNWTSLLALRLIIGIFEVGLFLAGKKYDEWD